MLDWLTVNVEILGSVATLFVMLSFVLHGELKFRWLNIIAEIFFVIYGLLLGAVSLWVLNIMLILINIYKLIRYSRRRVYHTIPRIIFNYKNNEIQNKK